MLWKTGKILSKEEEKKEEDNVRNFKVIDGGLKTGAKEPPPTDWLTRMTAGTTFLARPKAGFEPICGKFTVKGHAEGEEGQSAVELFQEGHEFWVEALPFCSKMKLVAVLERGIG